MCSKVSITVQCMLCLLPFLRKALNGEVMFLIHRSYDTLVPSKQARDDNWSFGYAESSTFNGVVCRCATPMLSAPRFA